MASSWSNVRSSGNSRIHAGPAYNYGNGAQHIQHYGTGPINNNCTTVYRGRSREREQQIDVDLGHASRGNSQERVKNLINTQGAYPGYVDQDGMTPLHHACASEHDNIEILKLLTGNGADLEAVNKAGESPLRVAINNKGPYSAKANFIRRRGGKDIGPRAVQLVHTGPPASAPQPAPASAPQNYNLPNYNFARDLQIIPDQKFSFLRSVTPPLDGSRLGNVLRHNSMLGDYFAPSDLGILDDYYPYRNK